MTHFPGLTVLQSALELLSYDTSECSESLVKFIELLGKDTLTVGLKKLNLIKVISAMAKYPGFSDQLYSLLEKKKIKSLLPVAWFVSFVVVNDTLLKGKFESLFLLLLADLSNEHAKKQLEIAFGVPSQKKKNSIVGLPSLGELKNAEPLHDNDFLTDFRKISVLPTVNEINCNYELDHVPNCWMDTSEDLKEYDLFDHQFRLLREDLLAPVKEELYKILNSKKENDFMNQKLFNPVAFDIGVYASCSVKVAFDPPPNLLKRLEKLKDKKSAIQDFFKDEAHKLLAKDALLLFVDMGTKRAVNIGLIVNRDPREMYEIWTSSRKLAVGVHFPDSSLRSILLNLQKLEQPHVCLSSFVIQSKVSYFAFEPVLKCLQCKSFSVRYFRYIIFFCLVLVQSDLFFKEELLSPKPVPSTTETISMPRKIQEDLHADPSQLQAVEYALSRRLAIIQGPPGTGKTFVGVKLMQTLLKDPKSKILCICYTNHALDSFLESLLDVDVQQRSIVRFGSVSKVSERIKGSCFQYLEDGTFDGRQKRQYAILKKALTEEEQNIKDDVHRITSRTSFTSNSWKDVKDYLLESIDFDLLQQFQVPESSDSGMNIVGKNNKILKEDHYFKQWCSNGKQPMNLSHIPDHKNLWNKSREERQYLLKEWWNEWVKEDIDYLLIRMRRYNESKKDLNNLREENKISTLSARRIIACTTTFAAKNRNLIDSCCPNIILVEEAAEIHESHVLTNLTSNIERVIMIGDHKQLRPKLEHFPLRVDSGMKIDFDVSLFERLVKAGYEPAQLKIQHRMRPSISTLIRETYPDLGDHDSVKGRDNIKGVERNVLFVSHNKPENTEADGFLTDLNSKSNDFEARLIIRFTVYLLQQGYQANDIVILTPYLGQLMKLRTLMRNSPDLKAELSERDLDELVDSDADSVIDQPEQRKTIRVATIDNFQGEESKIILASLVRSNDRGDIGFVSGPERINVLCSRARDGFYLFGNKETFQNAKNPRGREIWKSTIAKLNERGCVLNGIPVICQNHLTRHLITTPEEFDQFSPSGGCNEPCNKVLPNCQHSCPKKCHLSVVNGKDIHERQKCEVELAAVCHKNHPLRKICYQAGFPICHVKTHTFCSSGHKVSHFCDQPPPNCLKCKQLKEERDKAILETEERKVELEEQFFELEREKTQLDSELYHENEKQKLKLKEELLKTEMELTKNNISSIRNRQQTKPRIQPIPAPSSNNNNAVPNQTTQSVTANTASVENNNLNTSPIRTSPLHRSNHVNSSHIVRVNNIDVARSPINHSGNGTNSGNNNAGSNTNPTNFPVNNISVPPPKPQRNRDVPRNSSDSPIVPSNAPINNNNDNYRNNGPTSNHGGSNNNINNSGGNNGSNNNSGNNNNSNNNNNSPNGNNGNNGTNNNNNSNSPVRNNTLLTTTFSDIQRVLKLIEEEKWLEVLDLIKAKKPSLKLDKPFTDPAESEWMLLFLLVHRYLNEDNDSLLLRLSEIFSMLDTANANLLLIYDYVAVMMVSTDNKLKNTAINYANSFLNRLTLTPYSNIPAKTWKVNVESIKKELTQLPLGSAIGNEQSMKEKWKSLRENNPTYGPSPSMDLLLNMVGLQSVKESFYKLYIKVMLAKEQKTPLDGFNFNTQFVGNPGTGKTTVAQLFASFLTEIGFFDFEATVFEKTGSELITLGVDGLEGKLNDLAGEGGGVIFIDEAYQLNDKEGRPIKDCILGNAEKVKGKYGKLVWIIAGYKKQMEDFLKENPGLPSRFSEKFTFEDYTDEELVSILKGFFDRGGRDVVMKKPKKKKEKKDDKNNNTNNNFTRLSNQRNPNQYMFGNLNYFGNRPDETDQWGTKWKWDLSRNTYCDEYGNISGYGPGASAPYPLGDPNNPIVSTKNNAQVYWCYNINRKVWYNQNDSQQISKTYPGKPVEGNDEDPNITPFLVTNPKWIRVAARRIGRKRGVEGFGNARDIRTLFQQSHTRQTHRITNFREMGFKPNIYMFERNDLLGPKASLVNLQASKAWKELNQLEGLQAVKKSLSLLLETVITNADKEEEEKPLLELALNRVFLGNPGTGKTTIAKLYGQILADLGMLSKGEMILKNASDFIGSFLGKSEEMTRGILEQSKGSVLVIDEAYGLYSSTNSTGAGQNEPYREAVINTLVEQVQGKPGDDRAVIMIGYREEMEKMFKNTNPGLSRRFQLENAFQFDDYDDDALVRMLKKVVIDKDQMKISTDVAVFAIKQLARARARPHFGNAGAVNNLLSDAKLKMQQRIKDSKDANSNHNVDKDTFEKDDFKSKDYQEDPLSPKDLLKEMIGCDEIRSKLESLCKKVTYTKNKGRDIKSETPFNYLFIGNPGTGKTTVARLMGKMFHSLGLIPDPECIETTPTKFVTGYVGQAGKKTREMFKDARGKVLFIDEAYQLNPKNGGSFMKEVVDEMVACITDEQFKNQMIIILAGYEKDIKDLLTVNAGLQSRFSETFKFEDLTVKEVMEMIPKKLEKKDEMAWHADALSELPNIAQGLTKLKGFANGRDVETFIMKVIDKKIDRFDDDPRDDILKSDLLDALKEMQDHRKPANANSSGGNNNSRSGSPPPPPFPPNSNFPPSFPPPPFVPPPFDFSSSSAPPPPSFNMRTATQLEEKTKENEKKEGPKEESDSDSDLEIVDDFQQKDWDDLRPIIADLQLILDEKGWNNEEAIAILSDPSSTHPYQTQLVQALADKSTQPMFSVEANFRKWQNKQSKINKIRESVKEKQKKRALQGKQKSLVPIWRCAVCGRADQPYIACYVSPFIVRYEERDSI
jgi:replication-associated recombination protein RarA